MGNSPIVLWYTTWPSQQAAEDAVRTLIDEKLIACANVLPQVSSLYKWQGQLEKTAETVVLLKTSSSLKSQLVKRLAELHPYEVPCLIELSPHAVNLAYEKWLLDQLT